MSSQTKASWLFGGLFAIFLLLVFVFGPQTLPSYKQQLLAYICSLLAGFFAIFFTGSLLMQTTLPLPGKWVVQGGAGFALFLVVLFWWRSPSAPVSIEPAHLPECLNGTWKEQYANPLTWDFKVSGNSLSITRTDNFAKGTLARSGNSFSGTLRWSNGTETKNLILTPDPDCTSVTTNQSWSYQKVN